MDYDFLMSFNPRIIDVEHRGAEDWQTTQPVLYRERTLLNVLALVYGGTGTYEHDAAQLSLQSGHLFHLALDSSVKISSSLDEPLCFYSVHFDYGLLRWEGATGIWQNGSAGALPFPRVVAWHEKPALYDVYQHLFRVWEQKTIGYEWYARIAFMNILSQVAQLLHSSSAEDYVSKQIIRKSITYIKEHLSHDIDRNTLTQHVCLSPSYFSTLFKKHTGYSPIQYITKMRLDKAKRLLRTTNMPVHSVANAVGFVDSFYFTRVFVKEIGISPRDYRRA